MIQMAQQFLVKDPNWHPVKKTSQCNYLSHWHQGNTRPLRSWVATVRRSMKASWNKWRSWPFGIKIPENSPVGRFFNGGAQGARCFGRLKHEEFLEDGMILRCINMIFGAYIRMCIQLIYVIFTYTFRFILHKERIPPLKKLLKGF